jgi:predicted DNA-binding protein with PD1-like motif
MYAITSGVGMVDGVALGFFCVPRDDYDVTHIDGVLDLNTVSGNVARRDGLWVPHVHVTLNRPDYSVCGGHVMNARTHITMELWLAAPGTTGITRQTAGRYESFLRAAAPPTPRAIPTRLDPGRVMIKTGWYQMSANRVRTWAARSSMAKGLVMTAMPGSGSRPIAVISA